MLFKAASEVFLPPFLFGRKTSSQTLTMNIVLYWESRANKFVLCRDIPTPKFIRSRTPRGRNDRRGLMPPALYNVSYKSFHPGLISSISFIFLARFPAFSCFSRALASKMLSNSRNHTSLSALYRAVKAFGYFLLLWLSIRPLRSLVTPV
jgi:hypothetical protein